MTKLPAGFSTITPNIVVSDCAAAMALYEKALGAEPHMKMDGPDGKIIHASMKIERKSFLVTLIVLLHVVGALGTLIPLTRTLVVSLTPLNLLMSSVLLILAEDNQKKAVFFLICCFVIGFSAEVLGVKTGILFGDYQYGETLGVKLWEVPLVIGLNWFIKS